MAYTERLVFWTGVNEDNEYRVEIDNSNNDYSKILTVLELNDPERIHLNTDRWPGFPVNDEKYSYLLKDIAEVDRIARMFNLQPSWLN